MTILTEVEFKRELVKALPKLQQAAKRLMQGPQGADDLVNDTIVKAMLNQHLFAAGSNMTGWLSVIARNIVFTAGRRKKLFQAAEGEAEAMPVAASQFNTVHTKQVLDALGELSLEMQDAVWAIGLGDEYHEYAEFLGVPDGTIKSRVSRGRHRLLEKFGD